MTLQPLCKWFDSEEKPFASHQKHFAGDWLVKKTLSKSFAKVVHKPSQVGLWATMDYRVLSKWFVCNKLVMSKGSQVPLFARLD